MGDICTIRESLRHCTISAEFLNQMHVAVAGRSDLPCYKILLVLAGRKWLLSVISPAAAHLVAE